MGDGSNIEEILIDYANIYLQRINIPKNVKNIGMYAFVMCMGLENVVFEDNSDLTNIGMYSFAGCASLKTINLEDTKLEEIGNFAFVPMDESMPILIEEITLPNTLKTIGAGAFMDCTSLRTVDFGANSQLTSIGERTFSGCSSLTSIIIPNRVTSIGERTFSGCSSLTSIIIPNSVTSIGERTFYDCSSLTSITIPKSVTSIGSYAFRYCDTLTIYCEASSQPSGWDSWWNLLGGDVYWAGEWEYDPETNEPRPIE